MDKKLTTMIREPRLFSDTLERWEQYLADLKQHMPEGKEKQTAIEHAGQMIALKRRVGA